MRVLVIGASGLIGGRLIQHLVDLGNFEIRASSRSLRAWPRGVEGCVVDITQREAVERICRRTDAVVNLASVPEGISSEDPASALRVNAGGSLTIASAARASGVPRFVQVSTYKIYGNNPAGRVTEESRCAPESHYSATHHLAETYAALQHPNSVVFRLANGFGAPVNGHVDCWNIIVNEMCRQVVERRQISLRSSGLAWRNFIPLTDVVRALSMAVEVLPLGLYNLGSPFSMTLREAAKRVADVTSNAFGFYPDITVDSNSGPEIGHPLDYRIDKLAKAGFELTASFDAEVSATLFAAKKLFGRGLLE